jgi:hypothetical protein
MIYPNLLRIYNSETFKWLAGLVLYEIIEIIGGLPGLFEKLRFCEQGKG